MTDTYKTGKGRGTKTVQARQYTRDQDWQLQRWIGYATVYRDHIRIIDGTTGLEVGRATKGDWVVKHADGTIEIRSNRDFTNTYRQAAGEEQAS